VIPLILDEVVQAVEGRVAEGTPPASVRGVSTDSRTIRAGALFFALRGPRFDGHAYVLDALERGAIGAVIQAGRAAGLRRKAEARKVAGVLIEVDDPLAALGRLARYHREQLSADVIAVVGSNGKTTTKAMIDHVLGARLRGRCSPRSYNNDIGVPLTLLSAEASDDYLVVEIGTNAPGEIATLAALARPKMAVITNIGHEHLEKLRDLEGVALEECSVLEHLAEGGFAAVNTDWPAIRDYLPHRPMTVVTFGRTENADLRVTEAHYESPWLCFSINGRFAYRLRMPGVHNAVNAAGAIAVARRWGLEHEEIAERLATFAPPPMRSEVVVAGGVTLVNDAYNANPDSTLAAIAALEQMPADGRRVFVFGEMCELGSRSARLHRDVGERLRGSGVDVVVLVGRVAGWLRAASGDAVLFGPRVHVCETVDDCAMLLGELAKPGDVVWLKASRAVALDRVMRPLRAAFGGAASVS